jgi:hypothetical protein
MSIVNLICWSGLISMLAGLLTVLGALLHPIGEGLPAVNSRNWVPSHLVYWVAILLLHLGLVGLYARQVKETGRLGLVGFVLAFIGTALVGSILVFVSTALPLIAGALAAINGRAVTPPAILVPVFLLGYGLGWILVGLATMRAGVLPRWSGLLLIIGVTLFVISEVVPFEVTTAHVLVTVGDVIFDLGMVWIGYALWTEKHEHEKHDRFATRVLAW